MIFTLLFPSLLQLPVPSSIGALPYTFFFSQQPGSAVHLLPSPHVVFLIAIASSERLLFPPLPIVVPRANVPGLVPSCIEDDEYALLLYSKKGTPPVIPF